MEEKKIIVLNRMYSGEYLKDETNIGHEIINLFRTDDGANFIYLGSYGNYHASHIGRFESILLGRSISKNVFEVLGKAEELIPMPVLLHQCGEYKRKEEQEKKIIHEKQLEVLCRENITYGGVRLDQLYTKNKNDSECIYVTFKANKVRLPKKNLYITNKEDLAKNNENYRYICIKSEDKNGNINDADRILGQTNVRYFDSDTFTFERLKEIIDDESLWQETNTTEKLDKNLFLGDEATTFLDVIKKNDDEVVFSNLIAYYLTKYKPLLDKFIEKFVKKQMVEDVKVFREKYHIDILLQDGVGNSVIIENKIKSGINGKRYDENGNEKSNQLKKYIKELGNNDGVQKEHISCLLLVPNYHNFDLDDEDKDNYQIVKYSDVYNFFKTYVFGVDDFTINDKYYVDFVRALKPHAKEVNNILQEEMKRRFVASILANKR